MVLVSLAAAAATMTAVYAQASRTPERSFSSRIIPPGADLEVTVRMSGHVNAGTLVETIPAGFRYVADSVLPSDTQVNEHGREIRFTLSGATRTSAISYVVTAPTSRGQGHRFSGYFRDSAQVEHATSGDSVVAVSGGSSTGGSAGNTGSASSIATRSATPVPVRIVPRSQIVRVTAQPNGLQASVLVDPNEGVVLSTPSGNAMLTLPRTARTETFQLLIDSAIENCTQAPDVPPGVTACLSVRFYDARAGAESNVRLRRSASVQLRLTPETVDTLGGQAVLLQSTVEGALSVRLREGPDADWRPTSYRKEFTPDGGLTIDLSSLRTLDLIAVAVDPGLIEQARIQVSGATPTPSPLAQPTPEPTPSPETKATPEAMPSPTPAHSPVTPTPIPVDETPIGDSVAPTPVLLLAGITGAYVGRTGWRLIAQWIESND